MQNNIEIFNKEGLEFLSDISDCSIDLVLVDPPYITSKESGMDKWVKHVDQQNKSGSVDIKTEKEWENYKSAEEWEQWFDSGGVPESLRNKHIEKLKQDYLKYGSIYGSKYAVQTDFGSWDTDFTMEQLELFVKHFYRILKPSGTCIIFCDLWKISYLKESMEETKFKQLRFVEWIKTNPQPRNSNVNYLTNCREQALLGVKKDKPTFNSRYDNGIYQYPIYWGKDRCHPTQKSLLLFEDLITKHSNRDDTVLDCFLGSGTTALAAHNTGRKFIGCELDKGYYDKCMERMNLTKDKE